MTDQQYAVSIIIPAFNEETGIKSTLEKLKKLDEEKPDIIRKLPDLEDIKDWIEEAKKIK